MIPNQLRYVIAAKNKFLNFSLMEIAREIIREALPIKCLEAVILSLYLTNGLTSVDRFPISFKTVFNGTTFRHVVLGVYNYGRYGVLGMSRRKDLMYKPLEFKVPVTLYFSSIIFLELFLFMNGLSDAICSVCLIWCWTFWRATDNVRTVM